MIYHPWWNCTSGISKPLHRVTTTVRWKSRLALFHFALCRRASIKNDVHYYFKTRDFSSGPDFTALRNEKFIDSDRAKVHYKNERRKLGQKIFCYNFKYTVAIISSTWKLRRTISTKLIFILVSQNASFFWHFCNLQAFLLKLFLS